MKRKTRELCEGVFKIVTEVGCMKLIRHVSTCIMPVNISLPTKVCVEIGSTMLGGALGELAADWAINEVHFIEKAYKNGDLVSVIIG